METRKIKLSEIQPNRGQIEGLPRNPRKWDREDLERLKRSIEETPELMEARGLIVVEHEGKYVVLGGNMRHAAVKALGWAEVTAHVVPAGTPLRTQKEIVLKDNGQFGSWDYDELANGWDDLPLNDWGVKAWTVDEPGGEEEQQEEPGLQFGDARERIIITYPPDMREALEEIIGQEIKPGVIVYKAEDLPMGGPEA